MRSGMPKTRLADEVKRKDLEESLAWMEDFLSSQEKRRQGGRRLCGLLPVLFVLSSPRKRRTSGLPPFFFLSSPRKRRRRNPKSNPLDVS